MRSVTTQEAALDLLTRQEVAERFQVSTATVDRWSAAGHLPSVKIGRVVRFRRDLVERLAIEGFKS